VQFSPDGKQIVTASEDGSAWVWDAQTGQPITPHLQHGEHGLTTAQFSPNGKSILTTSLNSTAGLWDARNGEPLIKPLEQSNLVVSAQFSPDGRRILTLSADNTVRILDAQTGQPIIGPLQADAPVGFTSSSPDREKNTMFQWRNWLQDSQFPVMFNQDGQQFATASSDGIARVWDAQTGFPVTGLFLHDGAVWPVQFSPDGRQLLTASTDHRVRLWDLAPSEAKAPVWLLPMAEAISGKVLNKKGTIEKTQLNRLEVLSQLRQQFNQDPADNDWVVWGRWFLADPSTRTISPFSPITIREFIEHRLQECTAESLDDAERLAGVDSELLRRISEGRKRARAAYLESRIQESTTTSLDEAERLAEGNVDLLRRISQARKTIEENNRPMVLKAQADLLASQGKLIEAEPLYRQALLFNRNHWPNDPANWVSNLKDLVRVLTREGKPDAAEQLFNDILTPGLVTQPQSADLLRARGEFLARRGRWNDAAADFTKVIGLDPANHLDYHALAPLLVKSGKLEAYRENCRQALARFREAGNANVAERMVKDCLILPPSGVDSAVVDRWAERAVTIGKDSRDLPYFQFAKALAEYRQGRFASTVDWTQKALVKLGGDSFRDAQAYMVLAMAQHQLKQGDESHAALAKGLEVVDTHLPKLESGDIGDAWIDWIIAHALMSEARGLIEGK
jgi:tetratricopeptide (TPR) repeat protein